MQNPRALIWISGDGELKVALAVERPETPMNTPVDIYVRYHDHEVSLRTRVLGDYVRIDDLVGNAWDSGIQAKGFGRLATNVGFQYFRRALPHQFPVRGEMSTADESEADKTVAEHCRIRRRVFWERVGFAIGDGPLGCEPIVSTVGKLEVHPYGAVMDIYPRFVDLSAFTEVAGNPVAEWQHQASLRYPRLPPSWRNSP